MRFLLLVFAVLMPATVFAQRTFDLSALHQAAIASDPRARQTDLYRQQSDLRLRNIAAGRLPSLMVEGQAVAEKLGVKFAINVDNRIAGGAEVGAHKTSMLQDLERGRPLEIEALLGAVVEMSEWVGVDMPIGRSVLALVRQRAAMR